MTLQSTFHFLNLWDETNDQGEGRKAVRKQQPANMGPSQWANGHPASGKFVCVCVLL